MGVVLGIGLFALLDLGAAGQGVVRPVAAQPAPATMADAMLQRVNQARAEAGLPTYRIDPTLERVARLHAAEIARNENFSHTGLDGRSVRQRVLDAGYALGETNVWIGENFVARTTVDEGFAWWMGHEEHAINVLSSVYHEVGMGAAPTAWDGWVWVMDLGSYRGAAERTPPPDPMRAAAPPTMRPLPTRAGSSTVPAPIVVLPPAPAPLPPTLGPPAPRPTDEGLLPPADEPPPARRSMPASWARAVAQALVIVLITVFVVQAFRISGD